MCHYHFIVLLLLYFCFMYPVRRAHHLCACAIHLTIWVAKGNFAWLCARKPM